MQDWSIFFNLDIECVEEKFSIREPQFYKRLFQSNVVGQYGSKYPTFYFHIENANKTGGI